MNIAWEIVTAATFIIVGILQWFKGVFPKAPSKVWTWVFPPSCFVIYLALYYLPPWVMGGLLVWSAGQLGYENIVQVVKAKMGAKTEAPQ